MLRRAIIILLFAMLPALPVTALDPERSFDQYVSRTWLAVDGLPQNSVTSIVQAQDGYLWLGTWGGLAKFDGIRFETIQASDSAAFRSARILALCEDDDGRLWIGTERGGLVRYEDGKFVKVPFSNGIDLSVYALVEGPSGAIWAGTERGIFRFDRDTVQHFTESDGLPGNEVRAILFLSPDRAIVGTDLGTARFDGKSFTPLKGEAGTAGARSIIRTKSNEVWLGTHGGLFRIEGAIATRRSLGKTYAENEIMTLYEDSDGNLWAGRPGLGLLRIRGDQFDSISRADGLSSGSIRTIFEDREFNLWIGTDGGGLMLVRDGKAISWGGAHSPLGNSVAPIERDGEGGLWIGMTCGGLAHLGQDRTIEVLTKADGLHSDCIWALEKTQSGDLWVGSSGDGVSVMSNGQFRKLRDPVGTGLEVAVIFEDSVGTIWVGTNHGVLSYEASTDTLVQVTGTETYRVGNIYEAQNGALWIGTTRGILIFDGTTIREVIDASDGLTNEFVRAIHEDAAGVFWIGTYGGGLHRIARGQVSQFGLKDGLLDDVVSQIFETHDGDLWMSGNRGISRVRKSDIEAYLGGTLDTIPGESIGTADGMHNAECNGGGQPAGVVDVDGTMWFPTVDGIVHVDPSRVHRNTLEPPVFISSVRASGGDVTLSSQLTLPAGSRNIEIGYTALSFGAPEKVRFKYKMVGLDDDWVDAGDRRVAYYSIIPPGEYTFRVIAANNDGVWNELGDSLTFSLRPRLHQTPWVWLLVLLAFAATTYAIHKVRVAGLEQRENTLAKLVAERTTELETVNKELEELALIDSLTEIANHRRFREFLNEQWRRCSREQTPIAVAIVDIDYFKRFNDTYGHQTGDDCLRQVAGAMAAILQRPTDLFARYGGEEFVAVVANCNTTEIAQISERLRSTVEGLELPHSASTVASVVTITVGASSKVPDDASTLDDLIEAADIALYKGKSAGRNQVIVSLDDEV